MWKVRYPPPPLGYFQGMRRKGKMKKTKNGENRGKRRENGKSLEKTHKREKKIDIEG